MGIPLSVEYKNGILDLISSETDQHQGMRPLQNFPIKGAYVTYVRDDDTVVGAEIIRFDDAFNEIVASVKALRLKARYDVPQFGLQDAPLEAVLHRCYEDYVKKGTQK